MSVFLATRRREARSRIGIDIEVLDDDRRPSDAGLEEPRFSLLACQLRRMSPGDPTTVPARAYFEVARGTTSGRLWSQFDAAQLRNQSHGDTAGYREPFQVR